MNKTITLLVLWVTAATCEPLRVALQRRSDRPGIYASDYVRGYRPYTYMAIPLNEPVPVLHVLSSAPLYRPNRGIQQHLEPPRMRYLEPPRMYASSMSHSWYAPTPPAPAPPSDPLILTPVETVPASEILYARPKPGGGYQYSKKPFKKRVPPPVNPKEPMIIRIHKYRIIKDD